MAIRFITWIYSIFCRIFGIKRKMNNYEIMAYLREYCQNLLKDVNHHLKLKNIRIVSCNDGDIVFEYLNNKFLLFIEAKIDEISLLTYIEREGNYHIIDTLQLKIFKPDQGISMWADEIRVKSQYEWGQFKPSKDAGDVNNFGIAYIDFLSRAHQFHIFK